MTTKLLKEINYHIPAFLRSMRQNGRGLGEERYFIRELAVDLSEEYDEPVNDIMREIENRIELAESLQ